MAVLLHKHFLFRLSPFFNSASIITHCQYATMNKPNITLYVTLHFPFYDSAYFVSNFSSVPIVFRQFFTCTALGDVDLRFSLMLLRKCSAVEEETKWAAWLYHWCNQSIHLTEGVMVMSLSASLIQKINMHMNHLCKTAFNQKILCQFEKCCKFSSPIKAQLCNRSHLQLYLPVCKNMVWSVSSALQFQPCGMLGEEDTWRL